MFGDLRLQKLLQNTLYDLLEEVRLVKQDLLH